jgi:hypothetical protein
MEIVAEILVVIVQFIIEVLLQIVFEMAAEAGLHAVREVVKPSKPPQPWLAAFGYGLLGLLLGWVSLWPFPHRMAVPMWVQLVNLLVSPATAGGVMVLVGRWRQRRQQSALLLHRFWFGFLFALALALVRFAYGVAG